MQVGAEQASRSGRRSSRRLTPWLLRQATFYPKVGYVLILLDLLFIAWSLLTHPLGGAGSTPVIAVNGR